MKKIEEVKALPNYQLRINYVDGSQKLYSLYDLIQNNDYYKVLKERENLFKRVEIDDSNEGVTWGNELDLSGDELYEFEI